MHSKLWNKVSFLQSQIEYMKDKFDGFLIVISFSHHFSFCSNSISNVEICIQFISTRRNFKWKKIQSGENLSETCSNLRLPRQLSSFSLADHFIVLIDTWVTWWPLTEDSGTGAAAQQLGGYNTAVTTGRKIIRHHHNHQLRGISLTLEAATPLNSLQIVPVIT